MVAVLAGFVVVAAGAGVLWIFVYGDDPWPESANSILMTIATLASALTSRNACCSQLFLREEARDPWWTVKVACDGSTRRIDRFATARRSSPIAGR